MDNTQQREEGFSKMENLELQARVKELEYDCAELEKSNSELSDRVIKLANRQPMWPKVIVHKIENIIISKHTAGVAQLIEQLLCKHQVGSLNLPFGTK